MPGQPGVLDDLPELGQVDLAQARGPHQHGRVPVEVGRREERRARVLHQRVLVVLGAHPEHDHVVVALAGARVHGVWSGVPEEDERLPADGVHGVAGPAAGHLHVRHAGRQRVHVLDPCARRAFGHPDHATPRPVTFSGLDDLR